MKIPSLAASLNMCKRALWRMDIRYQARNPVMFTVYACALLSTVLCIARFFTPDRDPFLFSFAVTVTLWFTVFTTNVAELCAEDIDTAQTIALKKSHGCVIAKKIDSLETKHRYTRIPAAMLKKGDLVYVEENDLVPADGEIVAGVASVDGSSITGESAPVIREAFSDRSTVTWGTRLLSDWIIVSVSSGHGETTLDRMLCMLETAKRQKPPTEVALEIFLIASTLCFVVATATLYPFSRFLAEQNGQAAPFNLVMLIALFVCLAPTAVAALLPAIGIAGTSRLSRAGVLTTSGRAVETAGDVSILLLDKTGTITHGNRQAVAYYAAPNVPPDRLARASLLASLADDTPEGKSIVELAKRQFNLSVDTPKDMTFIPFSADTRMSGVRIGDLTIMKGADDAIETHLLHRGGSVPPSLKKQIDSIARQGGTPLLVIENLQVLGMLYLKDVVKAGIKERLAVLRAMGIQSLMITGDNPMTAAAIAAEAGVDDFIAQAVPETKLKLIRNLQESGEVVAMVGDGTNDAPALAQADIAIAMHAGAPEAKEASNMIDLDSNPTKIIEIIRIGKQLLMTRGSLATFSFASDITKYIAVMPAILISAQPSLAPLNFMGFSSPNHAMMATLIFNALIIFYLLPVALYGVSYRPISASRMLKRNILFFGIGGFLATLLSIKALDMLINFVDGAFHA